MSAVVRGLSEFHKVVNPSYVIGGAAIVVTVVTGSCTSNMKALVPVVVTIVTAAMGGLAICKCALIEAEQLRERDPDYRKQKRLRILRKKIDLNQRVITFCKKLLAKKKALKRFKKNKTEKAIRNVFRFRDLTQTEFRASEKAIAAKAIDSLLRCIKKYGVKRITEELLKDMQKTARIAVFQ